MGRRTGGGVVDGGFHTNTRLVSTVPGRHRVNRGGYNQQGHFSHAIRALETQNAWHASRIKACPSRRATPRQPAGTEVADRGRVSRDSDDRAQDKL
jgi:hypothetical protein